MESFMIGHENWSSFLNKNVYVYKKIILRDIQQNSYSDYSHDDESKNVYHFPLYLILCTDYFFHKHYVFNMSNEKRKKTCFHCIPEVQT